MDAYRLPIFIPDNKRRMLPKHFHIVQLGVGGTGGYVLRSLVRMIHSYQASTNLQFTLSICDGDSVEKKNLLRQDFIESDIHRKKVDVLADRFGLAYGMPIRKRGTYVEDLESLSALCDLENNKSYDNRLIVIGAVDNNATRQLINQYFEKMDSIIYIDAGNEGIIVSDKSDSELTDDEREAIDQSGYSGQVVLGWKYQGKMILPPVGFVYPDILSDKETFFPSQACGRVIVDSPQRRMTNEVAAMVITGYLNNLFATGEIVSHMTTFNAQNMNVVPRYITSDYMEYLKNLAS